MHHVGLRCANPTCGAPIGSEAASSSGETGTAASPPPQRYQPSSATMPAVSRAIASFIDAASTAPYPTRR